MNMSDESVKLKKLLRSFQTTLCGDAKASARVKAVNTLLNSGHDLRLLNNDDVSTLWESIFFALWHSEMGRGCEEIIAAVERACSSSSKLTRSGFQTMARKWYGLDQYRIDKVSHMVRHLLHVLLNQQIKLWYQSFRKSRRLGSQDVHCKRLLKRALGYTLNSNGLCYFVLENLSDEISRSLTEFYRCVGITVGKFELKANLIIFLYKQVISFVTNIRLDAGLLRTFDQYVIKKLIEDLLPNESQLTQILVTLRLHQALEWHCAKSKKPLRAKCRALLSRWSSIIKSTHEDCINGEYFAPSMIPIKDALS